MESTLCLALLSPEKLRPGCDRWKRTCPLDNPSNPSLTANILWPSAIPTLTAERTAAFIPAAGAPTFNTATLKELCGRQGPLKAVKVKLQSAVCLVPATFRGNQDKQAQNEKNADEKRILNYSFVLKRSSPWPHVAPEHELCLGSEKLSFSRVQEATCCSQMR